MRVVERQTTRVVLSTCLEEAFVDWPWLVWDTDVVVVVVVDDVVDVVPGP